MQPLIRLEGVTKKFLRLEQCYGHLRACLSIIQVSNPAVQTATVWLAKHFANNFKRMLPQKAGAGQAEEESLENYPHIDDYAARSGGVMILAGADSLREVIPFPKTARAVDLMVDAPTPVSEGQLKELGIKVVRKD
jgi:hypothetical protein